MNISNSLSIAWNNLLKESSKKPALFLLILLLSTITLPLGISNVLLGVYAAVVLYTFKKENLSFNFSLLLPILLFLWAASSLLWSIDLKESTSISKQIGMIIIPFLFLIQPKLDVSETQKIFKYFSASMVGFALFYLLKAVIKFLITNDSSVFFYHELVTLKVNAIYVSFIFSIAFLYYYIKPAKTLFTYFALTILLLLIVLLSSKNVLLVLIFLVIIYHLFFTTFNKKKITASISIVVFAFLILLNIKQVRDRFFTEFQSESIQSESTEIKNLHKDGIRVVSVKDAWELEKFNPNDFFAGTAFRVYQVRVFKELLHEHAIFWQGFGFNAVQEKIRSKSVEHNLFQGSETQFGYGSLNFHNQYIQYFAELGFVGLILLLIFAIVNLKNALKSRDFLHFAFAILLISLFLTECLLHRQRGVVFIVLLFCLFNQNKVKNHKIINNI